MGISVNFVRLMTTTVGGFLAGVGGAFLSLSYPGLLEPGPLLRAGADGGGAGHFRPMETRCAASPRRSCSARAGAIGPSLQSVGITQGYYFFNAAPYILTLGIMIATSSAKHSARDMPGELSMAK